MDARYLRAVAILKNILLTREGEVIDKELAIERARNGIQALCKEFNFETGTTKEVGMVLDSSTSKIRGSHYCGNRFLLCRKAGEGPRSLGAN